MSVISLEHFSQDCYFKILENNTTVNLIQCFAKFSVNSKFHLEIFFNFDLSQKQNMKNSEYFTHNSFEMPQ